jgi:hypothetical protein
MYLISLLENDDSPVLSSNHSKPSGEYCTLTVAPPNVPQQKMVNGNESPLINEPDVAFREILLNSLAAIATPFGDY